MAFNPFTPSHEKCSELASKLGINMARKAYVFQTSKGRTVREIYEVNDDTFKSLEAELSGSADGDILQGDRVFVLPGSMITGNRWEAYLQKVGARQVSDITKATIIIQNHKYSEENTYFSQARMSAQLISGVFHKFTVTTDPLKDITSEEIAQKVINEYDLKDILLANNTSETENVRCKLLYPHTLLLIDCVRSGIRLVKEDCFVPRTALGTVLDEEKCQSIISMLDSRDSGNAEVARQILFQCDIPPSWYYIWKIANSPGSSSVHSYGRDKNGRLFIDASGYSNLQRMTPNQFANFMNNKGLLTEEIFRKIKLDIATTAYESALEINDYYDVQLVIKPKYQHLDPNMELLPDALAEAIKNNKNYEDDSSEVEEDAELDRV